MNRLIRKGEIITAIIRPANIDDKTEIERIAKTVWNGLDYLPSVFESWLQDQRRHIFVLDDNSTLLGVTCFKYWAEAQLGWVEAVRVDGSMRKRGLGTLLFEYPIAFGQEKYNPKGFLFTTASVNIGSIKAGEKLVFRELGEMIYHETTINKLSNSLIEISPKDLVPISIRNVKQVNEFLLRIKCNFFNPTMLCLGWSSIPVVPTVFREILKKKIIMGYFENQKLKGLVLESKPEQEPDTEEMEHQRIVYAPTIQQALQILKGSIERKLISAKDSISIFCNYSLPIETVPFEYPDDIPEQDTGAFSVKLIGTKSPKIRKISDICSDFKVFKASNNISQSHK